MEQNQENEQKEYLNELKKRQARKKEQILNNDLNKELNNKPQIIAKNPPTANAPASLDIPVGFARFL